MDENRRLPLLYAATITALLAVPMTWMTVRNVSVFGTVFTPFGSPFHNISMNVTGLNGSLTFLIQFPIWTLMLICGAAALLQILRIKGKLTTSPIIEWGLAAIGLVWTVIPSLLAMGSGSVTPGAGLLLGYFAAVVPVVTLLQERRFSRREMTPRTAADTASHMPPDFPS